MASTKLIRNIEYGSHLLGRALERRLRNLGVNRAEAHVLAHIAEVGPAPLCDLRRPTAMTAAGVTAVVDRLEERGFVRRSVNPQDRRSVVIGFGNGGGWAAAEVIAMLEGIEGRVRRRVTEADMNGFERVLRAIELEVGR